VSLRAKQIVLLLESAKAQKDLYLHLFKAQENRRFSAKICANSIRVEQFYRR